MAREIGIPFHSELLDELIELVKLNEKIKSYETSPDSENFLSSCSLFITILGKSLEKVNRKTNVKNEDELFDNDQDSFKQVYTSAKDDLSYFQDICEYIPLDQVYGLLKRKMFHLYDWYIQLLKKRGIFIQDNINFIENDETFRRLMNEKEYLFILPTSVKEACLEAKNCFASRQWNAGAFMIMEAVEGMFSHYCELLYSDKKLSDKKWEDKIKALQGIEPENFLADINDTRVQRNGLAHSNRFWKELQYIKAHNYYTSAIKVIHNMANELKSKKKSYYVCVPPLPTLDIVFALWTLKKYGGGIGRLYVAERTEDANNGYYFCVGIENTELNYSEDVKSITKALIDRLNIQFSEFEKDPDGLQRLQDLRQYCESKTAISLEGKGLEYLFKRILLHNTNYDQRYDELLKLIDAAYLQGCDPEDDNIAYNLSGYEYLAPINIPSKKKKPAAKGKSIVNEKKYNWICVGTLADNLDAFVSEFARTEKSSDIIFISNLKSALIYVTLKDQRGNPEGTRLLSSLWEALRKNRSSENFEIIPEKGILRRKDDSTYNIILPEQLVSACFSQSA